MVVYQSAIGIITTTDPITFDPSTFNGTSKHDHHEMEALWMKMEGFSLFSRAHSQVSLPSSYPFF